MADRAEKARQAKTDAITAKVEEILADQRVNDELKRKIQYCQDALKRRPGDKFLLDQRGKFLKEAKR